MDEVEPVVLSDEVRASIRRQCEEATRFPGPRDVDPVRIAGIEFVTGHRRHLEVAARVAAEHGWRIEVGEVTFGRPEIDLDRNTYRMTAEQTVHLVRPDEVLDLGGCPVEED